MGLIRRKHETVVEEPQRGSSIWDDLWGYFQYNGVSYPYGLQYSYTSEPQEQIGRDFPSVVQRGYQQNGVIYACMAVRMALFSEARFQWRRRNSGRPGDLFGNQDLAILEEPWPNATTGDLLTRIISDVDLAGNSFTLRRQDRLIRLRPDWVEIVVGEEYGIDGADVVGYAYYEGGKAKNKEPQVFLVDEVAHFAPKPDPLARYRGMSWLTPIVREVMADKAMTDHRLKFFENGGTYNHAIKLNTESPETFEKWVDKIRSRSEGLQNAYKTLYLMAGSDVVPIGADLQQLDFKMVQGAGETRIAAAAEVPPVIVGLSEGLQAATYSNYQLAMRRFADLTMRPLWRMVAASLATLLPNPGGGAELWYDDRDIPALKDDITQRADVQAKQASAAKLYIDAGFEPDSVTAAIAADDVTLLVHSGLPTVQLQQPANGNQLPAPPPSRALADRILALTTGGGD